MQLSVNFFKLIHSFFFLSWLITLTFVQTDSSISEETDSLISPKETIWTVEKVKNTLNRVLKNVSSSHIESLSKIIFGHIENLHNRMKNSREKISINRLHSIVTVNLLIEDLDGGENENYYIAFHLKNINQLKTTD